MGSTDKIETLAIIGVGLIGGSIGLASRRRRLARRIVGIGRRPSQLRLAREMGSITESTTHISRGVAEADLVVVCTPVELIPDHVIEASQACPDGTLITDAGSAKSEILRRLQGRVRPEVQFVGSHPLAGSESSGPRAAVPELLDGKCVVVTPEAETPTAAAQRIRRFWQKLGARVETMSADEHDAILAVTSHLPHLVAAGLSSVLEPRQMAYVGDGWRDTTRIASGGVELWMQILDQNRQHVRDAMQQFAQVIAELQEALAAGDDSQLRRMLELGKRNRDALK